MTKRFCDRCKKETEKVTTFQMPYYQRVKLFRGDTQEYTYYSDQLNSTEVELCNDCFDKYTQLVEIFLDTKFQEEE